MVMLRWRFIAVVQLGGLAALFATGMVQKLWAVDVTKLSIVCLIALCRPAALSDGLRIKRRNAAR